MVLPGLNPNNLWEITKDNQTYLTHVAISIVIIYFIVILCYTRGTESIIDFSKSNIGRTLVNIGIFILCLLVLLQFKFNNVIKEAQKCTRPDDKSIPWSDNTRVWYKDPIFFILFIFCINVGFMYFCSWYMV